MIETTASAGIDVATTMATCAAARSAFENAKRIKSERPERLRAAKTELALAEEACDLLQIQIDVGGSVAQHEIVERQSDRERAEAAVATLSRSAKSDSTAVEILREKLTDARALLCAAMSPNLTEALIDARADYAAGLQMIRDAVTVVARIEDEMAALRVKVSDLRAGDNAWSIAKPSQDALEFLRAIDPAIRERDLSLQSILRP